jgi:hypothetical protein
MPEADTRDDKHFHEDIPAPDQGFLTGSGAYDSGTQNGGAHPSRHAALLAQGDRKRA